MANHAAQMLILIAASLAVAVCRPQETVQGSLSPPKAPPDKNQTLVDGSAPAGNSSHLTACPNACDHHGDCIKGKCECTAPWAGTDCSHMEESGTCKKKCNNHGWCVNSVCQCLPGWKGGDCSESATNNEHTCPNNCTGHGECHGGHCICDLGYSALDCSTYSHIVKEPCSNNCSGHGKCVDGACKCDDPWGGHDCSISSTMLAHSLVHNRFQAQIHGWGALGSAIGIVFLLMGVACGCSCMFNHYIEGRQGCDALPCADIFPRSHNRYRRVPSVL